MLGETLNISPHLLIKPFYRNLIKLRQVTLTLTLTLTLTSNSHPVIGGVKDVPANKFGEKKANSCNQDQVKGGVKGFCY